MSFSYWIELTSPVLDTSFEVKPLIREQVINVKVQYWTHLGTHNASLYDWDKQPIYVYRYTPFLLQYQLSPSHPRLDFEVGTWRWITSYFRLQPATGPSHFSQVSAYRWKLTVKKYSASVWINCSLEAICMEWTRNEYHLNVLPSLQSKLESIKIYWFAYLLIFNQNQITEVNQWFEFDRGSVIFYWTVRVYLLLYVITFVTRKF